MNEQQSRARLPQAYALSLWLRDLGFNDEQIASVLSIEREAIGSLLQVAELKVERLRRQAQQPGDAPQSVVVFVDGDDQLIDKGAQLARDHGLLLHLVAVHRKERIRTSSLDGGESGLRPAGLMRRDAERRLLHAARRALGWGVDVVPHAIAGRHGKAVRRITESWGPVIFVVRSTDQRRRALERAARRSTASTSVLDEGDTKRSSLTTVA